MNGIDWPSVPEHIASFLSRNFVHVRHLDAAFDSLEDCEELITSGFPGMVAEDVRNVAATLMVWKEDNSRALKRARVSVAMDCMYPSTIGATRHVDLQDEYKSILSSSSLCLLEAHAKRKQSRYKEEPADARTKRFEREKQKFALLLAEMVREADLPVAATINKLDDPKEGWLRLFSTRRANTLKNRYKAWKPFRDWLELP